MNLPLLKPALFASTTDGLVLVGRRVRMRLCLLSNATLGCERCGKFGAALQMKSLRGRGLLVTPSVMHLHADKRRKPPFAIGAIRVMHAATLWRNEYGGLT
jgi:hypothetical protein